jgi:hypothetical protein
MNTTERLKTGNWYRFNDRGETHIGQYTGRQLGFECCVCGKGCKAHTFNIWYDNGRRVDYETWGYGDAHMPSIEEDLGARDDILEDK